MMVAWDNLGGVCRVVNRVSRHLESQGHGVHLLLAGSVSRPEALVSREGFPAYRLSMRSSSDPLRPVRSRIAFLATLPLTLMAVRGILRRHRIDVVNVHFPDGTELAVTFMRRVRGFRIITSVHGRDLLPDGRRRVPTPPGLLSVLDASDAVVVPSRAFGGALHDAWPELDRSRLEVIPNGIDPAELGYGLEVRETATNPPYVLSVAHLSQHKGLDVLIRAFAAVRDSRRDLRLKLVSDGPARGELESLATSLGVREYVDFLGTCERARVAEHVRGCTLFVLPSRTNSESFGIAAAEAMAADRPVIASRVGGLVELIEDGVSGLLVPPDDDAALAIAMRRLLLDAPLRTRLGTTGGARVRRDYLWQRTGELYEALFHRVLSGADA